MNGRGDFKTNMVRAAAYNLKAYLDEEYSLNINTSDIESILTEDIGWLFEAVEEAEEFGRQLGYEQ